MWLYHDQRSVVSEIFRKMKLTILILCVSVFTSLAVGSYSQTTKLTVKMDDTSIKEILNEIEDQSEYRFFYSGDVNVNGKTDVAVENKTVDKILEEVFDGTAVKYRIQGRQVALYVDEVADALNNAQQALTVKGKVTDNTGFALPGVTVVVKGTTQGTITNVDGTYEITNVPSDAVLVFSFVGMKAQEVTVAGQASIDVVLEEETIGLGEVVAIGYGTAKKSDLTGSVTSLNAESLTAMKKADVSQAIQGRMAGVDVRRTNSKPGAPMSIRIRGNTSIQNDIVGKDGVSDDPFKDRSSPLYVVDGIFMENINNINPADIENMDILKDASATAIYGSRGANGVVIVTTKNGVEGKIQVTYDGTFGVNTAANVPNMMTGDRYLDFIDDVLRARQWEGEARSGNATESVWNGFSIDRSSEINGDIENRNVQNRSYYDWLDGFQETGIQTSHNIGFQGGHDGLVYNASVGYLHDEGVIGVEKFDRYTASLSLEKKFNDFISAGIKNYFSYSDREEGSLELFRSTFRLAPTVQPYDDEGKILDIPDSQDSRFYNPIYEKNGSWTTQTKSYNYNASLYLELRPFSWLTYRTSFNPELRSSRYGQHRGLLTKAARNDQKRTRAYYNTTFSDSYTWDNVVNMTFDVMEGHVLKATLISSMYRQQQEGSRIQTRNLDSDSYKFYNTEGGNEIRDYESWYTKETMSSFAARFNYDINGKYLFTFTGRYDGSSMLAEGNKWDFFPSAAFAWRVSEEPFMSEYDWLSNLKLRLSYGEAGNVSGLDPYISQSLLERNSYIDDQGKFIEDLANRELTWEVSKETNIGIDFGIYNNKIRLEADYYNKETDGAIFTRDLMNITGLQGAIGNYGSVRNRGVEIVLNTVNIDRGDFKWTSSINFAKNNNEILKLQGDQDIILPSDNRRHDALIVGEAITAMYALDTDGIWQMDEVAEAAVYNAIPGQRKYVDQQAPGEDGYGVIDENDYVVVGSHEPDWIGGMTNTFNYKDFDFSVMMYTRQGVMGHSEFYANFTTHQGDDAKFNKIDLDYWTPNNPGGKYPMPVIGDSDGQKEWYFEDMSFVRIGNIGLGYSVPSSFLNKFNLKGVRLSLDIQNPFTFTDYEGPDPETGLQNSYGMAYSVRTVLFGINVKL